MTQEQPRKLNPLDAIIAQFAKEGKADAGDVHPRGELSTQLHPGGGPKDVPQPWQPQKIEAPTVPTEQTDTLRDHPELVAHVANAAAESSLTLRRLETAQAERALLEQENARLVAENARLREQQTEAPGVRAPQDLDEARKKLDEIHERLAAPDFAAREVKENELSLAQKAAQELAPVWNDIEQELRDAGLSEEAVRLAGSQLIDDERGFIASHKDHLQSTVDWARRLTDPAHINERAEVIPIEFAEHLRVHASNLRKEGSHFINQQALDRLSELTLREFTQPEAEKNSVSMTIELGGTRDYDYVKKTALKDLLQTLFWVAPDGVREGLSYVAEGKQDFLTLDLTVKPLARLPQWIVHPFEQRVQWPSPFDDLGETTPEDAGDTKRLVSAEEAQAILAGLRRFPDAAGAHDVREEKPYESVLTEDEAAEVLAKIPGLVRDISDYIREYNALAPVPTTNFGVLLQLARQFDLEERADTNEEILNKLETFLQAVMDKSRFRDFHAYVERMGREGLQSAFNSWHRALQDRSKLGDPAALVPPQVI